MKLEKKDAWIKLNYRVKELETKIKQLQCPHNGFFRYNHYSSSYQICGDKYNSGIIFAKICSICNGIVDYITEEQSMAEQLEQKKKEAKVLKDRIKILSPKINKSPTKKKIVKKVKK